MTLTAEQQKINADALQSLLNLVMVGGGVGASVAGVGALRRALETKASRRRKEDINQAMPKEAGFQEWADWLASIFSKPHGGTAAAAAAAPGGASGATDVPWHNALAVLGVPAAAYLGHKAVSMPAEWLADVEDTRDLEAAKREFSAAVKARVRNKEAGDGLEKLADDDLAGQLDAAVEPLAQLMEKDADIGGTILDILLSPLKLLHGNQEFQSAWYPYWLAAGGAAAYMGKQRYDAGSLRTALEKERKERARDRFSENPSIVALPGD